MRIAIIGYGKMGKTVERLALSVGHSISGTYNSPEELLGSTLSRENTDVAIEFTEAGQAPGNIIFVLKKNIPVVSGTTGWWERITEIQEVCTSHQGTLIYGGNFSPGMNLLYQMNQKLAGWMNLFPEYDPWILEKHHNQKKDAPGGSALQLAEQILDKLERKKYIQKEDLKNRPPHSEELSVGYVRSGSIVGEHEVGYSSPFDEITLSHKALSRDGFAQGAILAAGWVSEIQGVQNFSEMFKNRIGI